MNVIESVVYVLFSWIDCGSGQESIYSHPGITSFHLFFFLVFLVLSPIMLLLADFVKIFVHLCCTHSRCFAQIRHTFGTARCLGVEPDAEEAPDLNHNTAGSA